MTSTEPVIIGVILDHRSHAVNVISVDDINSEEEQDQEGTTSLASSCHWVKIHAQRNYLKETFFEICVIESLF